MGDEEDLRAALLKPAFNDPLMEIILLELQQAIEESRRNGKAHSHRKR